MGVVCLTWLGGDVRSSGFGIGAEVVEVEGGGVGG